GRAARRQHGDLVYHQHLRPLDAGDEPAIGGERIEIAGVERLAHADAAPGMDGRAVAVRGGEAVRGCLGEVDALPLQPLDVAVDRMRLAAAGLACEKHRRASLEQSERFVLCHAAMPSGLAPVRKPRSPIRFNQSDSFRLGMPGLAHPRFLLRLEKTWMSGTGPAMTKLLHVERCRVRGERTP